MVRGARRDGGGADRGTPGLDPALAVPHAPPRGNRVPGPPLDTDLDQNASEGRTLTNHLYGGDDVYRLKQEIALGIGGSRLLRALGFEIRTYH